jgi:hypothetical protein
MFFVNFSMMILEEVGGPRGEGERV